MAAILLIVGVVLLILIAAWLARGKPNDHNGTNGSGGTGWLTQCVDQIAARHRVADQPDRPKLRQVVDDLGQRGLAGQSVAQFARRQVTLAQQLQYRPAGGMPAGLLAAPDDPGIHRYPSR